MINGTLQMGTEKQKLRPDNEQAKKLLEMAHFSPQLYDFTSMKLKGGAGRGRTEIPY